jgi:hypothetical protein
MEKKAWCVGGEAMGAEEFYVPSLFSTSFFLVVESKKIRHSSPFLDPVQPQEPIEKERHGDLSLKEKRRWCNTHV